MLKRVITQLMHATRCRRDVLIPMLEKLTGPELEALAGFLRNLQSEAKSDGRKQGRRDAMQGRFR